MTRNPGGALYAGHPFSWDALPLGYGLRTDLVGERTGEAASASYGLFSLFQGNGGRVNFLLQIAHDALKAQLSMDCKYIFR